MARERIGVAGPGRLQNGAVRVLVEDRPKLEAASDQPDRAGQGPDLS